ncbi:tRNA (adenine(22)-N(1))-methyltransferase [Falsibacillus albus]|uniref:tRNA (Adenine-N(1))-methyltransferase n=1 Tax=Falsibacillus albus TaxID=2478915 RepID=A0A3L7K591_9BACI|nr:tRNA (adenine(22)-N(1))-methyltransferase TrmK [Falsibacillus albus]RLQ98197.1 tRNA (adenine-N(1))-methyltransferase [Falsibacillus albus]
MNTEKLSTRLERVAKHIPKGARVADIGSDHAYLPCYCILNDIASYCVAGEVVEGPYRSALNQVKQAGLENQISVRKGNGLEVISENEVNCITIAGMGGPLIASILEEGKNKLDGVDKLILQPNIGSYSLRKWLLDNGWELAEEEIIEEDGKIYEILVSVKGTPMKPYQHLESELLMGPFLMKENNEVFRKKWEAEMKQWKIILMQLEQAGENEKAKLRKAELSGRIELVQGVLST